MGDKMKEKLAKKEFIKNFEYFKRNVAEYDKKRDPKLFKLTMWLMVPLVVMLIALLLPLFLIPHWYIYLMVGYAAVSVPLVIIIMVIHDLRNMKAITFDKMVYKGKLEDLFTDVSHPAIVNAKHVIEYDMKKYTGITGNVAYYLYEEMNKPEYAAQMVNIKSTDEKVIMVIETEETENNQ